eukprot:TRINITY_DN4208_c0_g1_i2.p1 TRINITY_DN4208_c0_g1~~TRINITY_DN4208_c0_g1_i2.p1  ORF type:complete len:328 (+),score=60.77 TRINITY_DN4208_c0_g1_i2:49-1032(+)
MSDSLQITGVTLIGRKDGVLSLSDDGLSWKSSKSSHSVTLSPKDLEAISWYPHKRGCHMIAHAKSKPSLHFKGISEKDIRRITHLAETAYSSHNVQVFEEKFNTKGWNWGKVQLRGSSMMFKIADQFAFNLQLRDVSSSKVEGRDISISMHGDESSLSGNQTVLDFIRLHVPISYNDGQFKGETAIEELNREIDARAESGGQSGKAIAKFPPLAFVTPRARYAVELCETYFRLIGPSFKFTIPYNSITRMYHLPKPDQRSYYFVISLNPPLHQGQTAYEHIVMSLDAGADDEDESSDSGSGEQDADKSDAKKKKKQCPRDRHDSGRD